VAFRFEPLTEAEAREIIRWRYPAPYDFYDLGEADPDVVLGELFNPNSPHFAISTDEDDFLGFCLAGPEAQVPGGDYLEPALDIGIGLRPDATGRGLGKLVLIEFLEFVLDAYHPDRFRATIAAFNLRSQRTFLGLDFVETSRFFANGSEWVIVTRAAVPPIPG
jgi:[ribosomal protein S18]-alanine N-acetyltransferase